MKKQNSIISVQNVGFSYSKKKVLSDISFEVEQGTFLSVIGPNGSGKTTLIKLINALLVPDHGSISVNSISLKSLSEKQLSRIISWVPQEINVTFDIKVHDLVLWSRFAYVESFLFESKRDYEIVDDVILKTGIKTLSDRQFQELSSGEKQRVLLASALVQEPQVLLLDEPTSNLDLKHQIRMFSLLKQLNSKNNLTIISVVHDINIALAYSDRALLLNRGNMVSIDNVDKVLRKKTIEEIFEIEVSEIVKDDRTYIFHF